MATMSCRAWESGVDSAEQSSEGGAAMIRSPFPDVEIPDVSFTEFVLTGPGVGVRSRR
jgi:hypothetical protein